MASLDRERHFSEPKTGCSTALKVVQQLSGGLPPLNLSNMAVSNGRSAADGGMHPALQDLDFVRHR